jgi:hypothetical protein
MPSELAERAEVLPQLNRAGAEALTAELQSAGQLYVRAADEADRHATRFAALLAEAYERGAHRAMGCTRFEVYVQRHVSAEGLSRAHIDRLRKHIATMRAFGTAAGIEVSEIPQLPERHTRELRPHVAEVSATIRSRTAGLPRAERPAVVAAVAEERLGAIRRPSTTITVAARPAPVGRAPLDVESLLGAVEVIAELPDDPGVVIEALEGRLAEFRLLPRAAYRLSRLAAALESLGTEA